MDDIKTFPLPGSSNNIWNVLEIDSSDKRCYEINDTYGTQFDSFNISSYPFCQYWNKREEYINTDYYGTGWMLCVIPSIHKDVIFHSNEEYINQVNICIKTLFHGLS